MNAAANPLRNVPYIPIYIGAQSSGLAAGLQSTAFVPHDYRRHSLTSFGGEALIVAAGQREIVFQAPVPEWHVVGARGAVLQLHQLGGEAAAIEIAAVTPGGIERIVVIGHAAMLEAPFLAIPGEEAILPVDIAVEGASDRANHHHMRTVDMALPGVVDMRADDRALLNGPQHFGRLFVGEHAAHALARMPWAAVDQQHRRRLR